MLRAFQPQEPAILVNISLQGYNTIKYWSETLDLEREHYESVGTIPDVDIKPNVKNAWKARKKLG